MKIQVSTEINVNVPVENDKNTYINPSDWKHTGEYMIFTYKDDVVGEQVLAQLQRFNKVLVKLCE